MQALTFLLALFIFLFSPILLIVAMITPTWVNRHLKRKFTRKEYIRNLLISTVAALGVAIFAVPAANSSSTQTAAQVVSPSPETIQEESSTITQEPLTPAEEEIEPAMSPSPYPSPSPSSTATPKPIRVSSTTPEPTPTPTSAPKITTGGSWACSCSKTCSQMSSCAEAQYQLNICRCGARDADKDGIACDADCQ